MQRLGRVALTALLNQLYEVLLVSGYLLIRYSDLWLVSLENEQREFKALPVVIRLSSVTC